MPSVPVKITDPFLIDLQANILKFHGRKNALHLFIVFDEINGVKAGIQQLIDTDIITNSKKQLDDATRRSTDTSFDGGPVVTFSISGFGYTKLGQQDKVPQITITDFADNGTVKIDNSLLSGMKASAVKLDDDTDLWDEGFKGDIDALITVGDGDEENDQFERLNEIIAKIKSAFGNSITVVASQPGTILRNSNGIGIEHFGYVDGVSQPIYLEEEINDEQTINTDQWSDVGILDKLIVSDPGGKDADSFGSFLVFRKLEQNVKAFKEAEQATEANPIIHNGEKKFLSPVLARSGNPNNELAGAMNVGRFEDGTEVVNDSNERGIVKKSDLSNNFDYSSDPDALKCPFHSHIRITNPRGDVGTFAKEVRITRRGIPYNEIGRNVNDLENDQPQKGVGLLFQCYQSSIIAQFEFIQKAWANDGDIGGDLVGQDPIIGQGVNPFEKKLPKQWKKVGGGNKISFFGFVSMKGGEYFFTPSISFLKSLGVHLTALED